MRLSEIKEHLNSTETLLFLLENGTVVPEHFHVTEVGVITRHFIDCGGKVRHDKVVNFQLWVANDFEHRLEPDKLLNIIRISEEKLGIGDFEIEIEYQTETIGKYNLEFNGQNFVLASKQTACLAADSCGNPLDVFQSNFSETKSANSCKPGTGCC